MDNKHIGCDFDDFFGTRRITRGGRGKCNKKSNRMSSCGINAKGEYLKNGYGKMNENKPFINR